MVTGGELPELPGLRALNLKHCPRLHDAGLAAVAAACPGLAELHLRAEELSGAGLAGLAALRGLTRLELLDARAAAADGLAAAVAALTGLEARHICRPVYGVQGLILGHVFGADTACIAVLRGLSRLALLDVRSVTAKVLAAAMAALTGLEVHDQGYCLEHAEAPDCFFFF